MHERFCATIALLVCAIVTVPARAQQAPAVPSSNWKESWRYETNQSLLRAPRSLAVSGDCFVWIADSEAGLFRVPCAGGVPARVDTTPGEQHTPWAIARHGTDSVVAFDRDLQRVTTYAATGAMAGNRPLRLPEAAFGQIVGIAIAGGALRAWASQFPSAADPSVLPSLVLELNDAGRVRDTLASLEGLATVYWGSTFGSSRLAVPNQRRPLVAFLASGGFVVGNNSHDRVTVCDIAGKELRTLTLALPPAQALSRGDRDAYADSVRKVTAQEMNARHYNPPEVASYKGQIETYLKEDVTFPERRQRYDLLVVDEREESVWVLLPGTGKNYARTWEVYSLADGALQRRQSVPHKGAVTAAVVHGGALYAVEVVLGAKSRVAKYVDAK